jgi:hypothetical protein
MLLQMHTLGDQQPNQALDGKTANELNVGFLLYAEHFESSQYMNAEQRSSLITNAVPTFYNIPNPPNHQASNTL